MHQSTPVQLQRTDPPGFKPAPTGLVQRRCACGGSPGPSGECAECRKKHLQHRSTKQVEPTTVPPIVSDVLRSPGQSLDPDARDSMESRFGHDFSRVRVHSDARAAESARAMNVLAYTIRQNVVTLSGTSVQAQAGAAVASRSDLQELEADEVANQVVRDIRQLVALEAKSRDESQVSRVAVAPLLGRTPTTPDHPPPNSKTFRSAHDNRGPAEEAIYVREVLRYGGAPLNVQTRALMEPHFGFDFSAVRVHTGHGAASSALVLSALAYTVGNHIVFAPGRYDPASEAGQRLLAHELTHVVQQGKATETVGSALLLGSGVSSNLRLQRQPAGGRGSQGGGGDHSGPEAGAVGSVQFCVDFCSGDYRISGWIWVGAGYRVGGKFVGPSAMYEGTLARGNTPSLRWIECGECDPNCVEPEGGWSGGLAVFPQIFSPNAGRRTLSLAGLECGVLFIPSSRCHAAIEGICFLDLIQYLGPIGRIITVTADRLGLEAKAGVDGGVTIELCRGTRGGVVAPRGEVCLGGFIEVGRGLSRNKADHT